MTQQEPRKHSTHRKADINVTPYIDILLVLLIIFMVIQPMTEYDLETRIPELPSSQESAPSVGQIVVSLANDGGLSINGQETSLADLGTRLFAILSGRADRRLFVAASQKLAFGEVIRVIDIAKGAGAADIGLVQSR